MPQKQKQGVSISKALSRSSTKAIPGSWHSQAWNGMDLNGSIETTLYSNLQLRYFWKGVRALSNIRSSSPPPARVCRLLISKSFCGSWHSQAWNAYCLLPALKRPSFRKSLPFSPKCLAGHGTPRQGMECWVETGLSWGKGGFSWGRAETRSPLNWGRADLSSSGQACGLTS